MFSIVQRGGEVYSRHLERVTSDNLRDVMDSVCATDAYLMTDSASALPRAGKDRKESIDEEGVTVTTNLDEQSFRFNKRTGNDFYRFIETAKALTGRRLTFAELTGETTNH